MKHTVLIVLLLVASGANAATGRLTEEARQACAVYGNIAGDVMEMRQDGVEFMVVLEDYLQFYKEVDATKAYQQIVTNIITDAYIFNVFSSEVVKDKVTKTFKLEIELECITFFRS